MNDAMIRGSPNGLSRAGHHTSGPALLMVVIVLSTSTSYGNGKHEQMWWSRILMSGVCSARAT